MAVASEADIGLPGNADEMDRMVGNTQSPDARSHCFNHNAAAGALANMPQRIAVIGASWRQQNRGSDFHINRLPSPMTVNNDERLGAIVPDQGPFDRFGLLRKSSRARCDDSSWSVLARCETSVA